jgi:hypothetical protein
VIDRNLIINYFYKYNYLFFFLICFLSSIAFLSDNISFGFVWDWSMPSNELFLKNKLENNELHWNNSLYGGFNSNLNFELWFWRFIGIVNSLSFGKGVFFSLFIFQFLAFIGFYEIGKIYNKKYFLISLFYIYSYYAYSRLVAGHLNLLMFYWSLPILFVCLSNFYGKGLKKTSIYQILFILVTLVTLSHPFSIIIFSFLLIFFFLKKLIDSKNKIKICFIFIFTLAIFFLTQFHLIYSLLNTYLGNVDLFESYKSYQVFNEISDTQNVDLNKLYESRIVQHHEKSFGILFYFLTIIQNSMFYENAFFTNIIFIRITFLISFIIILTNAIIISFKEALVNRLKFSYIYITFLLIVFILLVGSNNLISKIIYFSIANLKPNLFTIFANPLRFAPLFLFFLTLILLLNNKFYMKKFVVFVVIVSSIQFFFFKFLNFDVTKLETTQPNRIIKKQINFEEIEIEKNLRDDKNFYKIIVLPPAFMSWSFTHDNSFTIPWNSNYFSKSNLLASDNTSLEKHSNKYFFTINNQDFNYNLLLKISNVKYLILPNYNNVYLYNQFIKDFKNNTFNNFEDYSDILRINLENLNLKKSKLSTNNINVYEVNNFYPEFYCPTKAIYYDRSIKKSDLRFSDSVNNYYVFTSLNKKLNLCKRKYEIKISSPIKNIYNINLTDGNKINSFIFNNTYDKNWSVIPGKSYKNYLEILNYIFTNKEKKIINHFEVNFNTNYWNFDKNYEFFTIFNYNEFIFYFTKIFQILLIFIFIVFNLFYLFKNKWQH